jgi:hypothetical protein
MTVPKKQKSGKRNVGSETKLSKGSQCWMNFLIQIIERYQKSETLLPSEFLQNELCKYGGDWVNFAVPYVKFATEEQMTLFVLKFS